MTSPQCLPPTSRDFLVYERIVIDHATTRQAAEEVGLSQTRIRQIVHRVEEYLATTLAAEGSETTGRGRLRLAQCIAADRLHELYCGALERWNATQESKYLTAVLRLITAHSKLAAQPFTIGALASDVIEGPLDAPVVRSHAPFLPNAAHSNQPTAPPIEDCSNSPPTELPIEPISPLPAASTPANEPSYSAQPKSAPHSNPRSSSTAQTPSPAPAAIAQLRITPATIDLTTAESLAPTG
jgi:hypothetical protein